MVLSDWLEGLDYELLQGLSLIHIWERIRNRKNRQGGRKSRPAIKTATPTMGGVRVRSP